MAGRRRKISDCLTVLAAIFRARVLRARFPLAAIWNVTFRCDLRCRYCGSGDMPGGELAPAEAMKLLEEMAALGMRWLTFSGGEPLLRADLGDLIRRALEKQIHVRISTNGMLLPRRLDDLKGVDAVSLSLDGPQDVHDRTRGKGTFRAVLAAIEACKAAGIAVNLKCTLNRDNLETTDELLEIASRHGAPVMFQPMIRWGNLGAEQDPLIPDAEPYRRTIRRLIERKRGGAPILNSVAGLRYLANWPDAAKIPCYAGILFCSIQPDGSIAACWTFESPSAGENAPMAATAEERVRIACKSRPKCRLCWCAPMVEFNLMLALRPGPILNALRMGL